jgi:D-arabinose 1-dehydrogenase-like Zn-dependent alcohol dehydrogenase
MKAMLLRAVGESLYLEERPELAPAVGQIRVRVEACAVCRTDLHVVDGELPNPKLPLVPGHEIVGIVDAIGSGVETIAVGTRVGVPWLGRTCAQCEYCLGGRENLCDHPIFTGYTRDGGFATHVIADAAYAFPLDEFHDPVATAPLLCAGLIGWRSLRLAGDGIELVCTVLVQRRTSLPKFVIGKAAMSMPLPGQATARRKTLPSHWARNGLAAQTTCPPNYSMQRLFLLLRVTWSRRR